ncbi:hypothetical protein [Thermococcus sp. 21S7]|uniref:hypothetical protein n=1 Tax=Thermococcus sp. 21S7 TaxID=1638221 RepID=UPI00197CF06E|nr:hypothetical protein [Thermococcus sp. 21S7]
MDRVVFTSESSNFEESLVNAFKEYLSSGVYFAPTYEWKFRKILSANGIPTKGTRDENYREKLLIERYRLAEKLLGILAGRDRVKYSLQIKPLFRGVRKTSDIEPPYVEFVVTWGRLTHKREGTPAGLLIKSVDSRDAIMAYYEEVLSKAFDNEIYSRLWDAYFEHLSLSGEVRRAKEKKGAEKYHLLLDIVDGLDKFTYEGKGFPSFPGILRRTHMATFPAGDIFERFYSVPLYGEGWDKEKSVLRVLLENADDRNVREFLEHYEIGWLTLEDLDELFSLQQDVISRVNEMLGEIIPRGRLGSGLKVLPLYIQKASGSLEKVARITPTKIDRVPKTTYLVTVAGKMVEAPESLEGFLTLLMANSYYLPREVLVLLQKSGYRIGRTRKTGLDWPNVVKATFDSAVIYALLEGRITVEGFENFTGHLVFLNYLGTRSNVRNTVFHDYYYHLLDGIETFDKIYRTRARTKVNVQNFNKDHYPYAKVPTEEALKIDVHGLEPVHLYTFDTGFGGVVFKHVSKKCISRNLCKRVVRYYGAERIKYQLSKKTDSKEKKPNMGSLASSKEYYSAMSFRNTSTAGYILEINDREVKVSAKAHSVSASALLDRGENAKYLRLLRTSKYGPDKGGRVRFLLEDFVFRRDNPGGEMNSANEIFNDLLRGIGSSGDIHLIHIQNLANSEYFGLMGQVGGVFVDWDGLMLSIDGVWDVLGNKWDVAVLSYDGHNCRVFLTVGKKGKRRKSNDSEPSERSMLYRHPVMIFSSKPLPRDEELLFLLGMGDEKGMASFLGIKRLFYSPYPDTSRRLMRPSLLLGGVEGE